MLPCFFPTFEWGDQYGEDENGHCLQPSFHLKAEVLLDSQGLPIGLDTGVRAAPRAPGALPLTGNRDDAVEATDGSGEAKNVKEEAERKYQETFGSGCNVLATIKDGFVDPTDYTADNEIVK